MKLMLIILIPFSANNTLAEEHSCFSLNKKATQTLVSKNFTQKRLIKGLSKPIESSGVFHLHSNSKIEWITKKPFYSAVVVSENGFEVKNEENIEKFDQSYFKEIGTILVALHSQDINKENYEKLNEKFELLCVKKNRELTLTAIPKDASLKKIIKQILIQGENSPNHIKIEDGRGDITEIILEAN